MTICPNCNHQNPEGSVQCESCYTALPSTYSCPNCGASVQTDATFCGQCGFNLQRKEATPITASNPFDNNDDYSLEEDSIPTTPISAGFEPSPWDMEEDLSLEEEPLFFDQDEESLELGQVEIEELPDSEDLSLEEEPLFFDQDEESLELGQVEIEELPDSDDLSLEEEPLFLDREEELSAISSEEYPELGQVETEELPDSEDLSLEGEPLFLDREEYSELGQAETEETEDIESWISSVQEESALEDNSVEETSELAELEEEIEINPRYAIMEAETRELDFEESETIQFVAAKTESEATKADSTEETTSSNIVIDQATEIQKPQAILFHIQTETQIEIPFDAEVIRMGKPNSKVPPDIDVSGFSNSEIVSRIHADIKAVEDAYYIEDRGSSNGTYINDSPLPVGSSHCLQEGDRIALGKGDLVSFIFQLR